MLKTGAEFSTCRTYRYALWRIWDSNLPGVLFIGLNPSTADEVENDPTIRRCMSYALSWGFGSVYVGNIFAYRSTNPKELVYAHDPVGPENDAWLLKLAEKTSITVAAWGNHGEFKHRDEAVKELIPDLYCLTLTKSNNPAHPLYLPSGLVPQKFIPNFVQ